MCSIVLLPWKLRQSLPHVEVRFLAPRCFLLFFVIIYLLAPARRKFLILSIQFSGTARLPWPACGIRWWRWLGPTWRLVGLLGPGARGMAKGSARAKGPHGVPVGMGLGLGLWLGLRLRIRLSPGLGPGHSKCAKIQNWQQIVCHM